MDSQQNPIYPPQAQNTSGSQHLLCGNANQPTVQDALPSTSALAEGRVASTPVQALFKNCLIFPCFSWGFSQWKGLTLQAPEPVPNIGPESSWIVIPGYKYAGSLWETHQNW